MGDQGVVDEVLGDDDAVVVLEPRPPQPHLPNSRSRRTPTVDILAREAHKRVGRPGRR